MTLARCNTLSVRQGMIHDSPVPYHRPNAQARGRAGPASRAVSRPFSSRLSTTAARGRRETRQFPPGACFFHSFVSSLCFFNFRCRVVRLIPNARAASAMLLSLASRVWSSACLSISSSVGTAVGAGGSESAGERSGGRLLACNQSVVSNRTARSMALLSSRTLPGQSAVFNRCSAAMESPLMDFLARSVCFFRKCRVNRGISSRRSLSSTLYEFNRRQCV